MYFFDMPKQEDDGPLPAAVEFNFCCWAEGALSAAGGASRLSSVPVSNLVILASGSENSYSNRRKKKEKGIRIIETLHWPAEGSWGTVTKAAINLFCLPRKERNQTKESQTTTVDDNMPKRVPSLPCSCRSCR